MELYNLQRDRSEANDMADRQKERVQAMNAQLMKELSDQEAKLPRINPAYQR